MFDLMKLARIAIVAVGAISAWGVLVWRHDAKVVKEERARVTEANRNAAKSGTRAADKSRAGGVRQRDPLTRD